ncbi:MAG: hypothetical protein A2Y65_10940 [Deltaproteobacteria bacterium RBG_13_52_11]|nr:MAG: hypothetical protein A2Y65_10940 [Deltaproteobacteria bacterium RBG_13_52_11]
MNSQNDLHLHRLSESLQTIHVFRQERVNAFDSKFKTWKARTQQSLEVLFGRDHGYTRRFSHLVFWETRVAPDEVHWSSQDQKVFEDELALAEQILSDAIEELGISPPASTLEKVSANASPLGKEKMDILIGWSKAQSKIVASALHQWLPEVLPGIKPWMSSKDIAKGREWFQELQGVLTSMQLCIICVTPENVRSPWIYYETGAIAAKGSDVLICPYLVGVLPNMLTDGPLGNWQCTVAERDDTWELIKSLNKNALKSRHDLSLLKGNFDARWSDLEAKLQAVKETEVDDADGFVATEADRLAGENLSAEARTIILEVLNDPKGMLRYITTLREGTAFLVGGKNLCPDQSPRTMARWAFALKQLLALNILESHGATGNFYKLTKIGFDIADSLEGKG